MKLKSLVVVIALLVAGFIVIWLGVYNIAATERHWALTSALLELVRERSIDARLEGIEPPKLDAPGLIAEGAEHYAAMCARCHLAPGKARTDIYQGLYPQPPLFYQDDHEDHDPRATFWVIKNGLKLTGMPAWGVTHDDQAIWGLVAFVRKLQEGMSAEEYRSLIGKAASDVPGEHEQAAHNDDHGHDHSH